MLTKWNSRSDTQDKVRLPILKVNYQLTFFKIENSLIISILYTASSEFLQTIKGYTRSDKTLSNI